METQKMTAENRTAHKNKPCSFHANEGTQEDMDGCAYCGYAPEEMTDGKTSQINGLGSVEERLDWCEEYIKALLSFKDESRGMHNLDGKDISDIKQRLSKLEGGQD